MSKPRTRTLTRGEVGLAEFHRIIGYASAAAALCLMGASVTALFWFAGVIGLPVIAQALVALAIEVMAASLAASATTAFRDGGKVDVTAWLGFAFFISIAAFANIMHVITFIDTSVAPVWFGQGAFITASCIFAAACPLGGTWGVHRFGWLRAHGADAQWQDDAHGQPVVVAQSVRAQRSVAAHPRAETGARVTQSNSARPPAPAAVQASDGLQAAARVVYDRMRAEEPGKKPDAAAIHRDIESPKDVSTTRRWVQRWWDEDTDLHAADPVTTDPIVAEIDATNHTLSIHRAG